YAQCRTVPKKLNGINAKITRAGWTLGEFLYYAFQPNLKGSDGEDIKRLLGHSKHVSDFLGGRSNYLPIHILQAWYKSPYG
ncbi:hypothetical protein NEOLEDRAFT_1032020, partial [Neolentinus lepideus HHB14362 ss-1]